MTCEHDGNCGIQQDIKMMLGDWRYPKCRRICDMIYGLHKEAK